MTIAAVAQSSSADRARSLMTTARTATLLTRSCRTPATRTVVALGTSDSGVPGIRLEGSAPAVAALAACRVATLTVAGRDGWVLRLTGSFTMGRPDASGIRTYTPTLLALRLVAPTGPRDDVVVAVDSFLRARPDVFGEEAAAVLAHLGAVHAEDLLTRAWREGYDAAAVVPRSLDRDGVELAVLGVEGVQNWRVPFTTGSVDDAAGLRAAALPVECRCPLRN